MLKTIRLNNTNDLVKVAKYLIGYDKIGEATDLFDEKFAAEVGEWQSNHKLNVDYIIGPKTWTEIAKSAPTCSTSKNKKSIYTCALQILLGGLEADGIFGTKTKKAVAAFQTSAGLTADGICGAKTWNVLITGETASQSGATSGNKILNNCVKYLQWDKKWKNVKYSTHTSKQTIGNSGCGPTSMAMIMATFIDSKITPVEMAALSVKAGYRTYDDGTDWGFYKYVFNNTDGFDKYLPTNNVAVLMAALREGALAVCSMNSGDNHFWTKGGCINKMASLKYMVNLDF